MLTAKAHRRVTTIQLPDLGAGADVAAEVAWRAPSQGARILALTAIFQTATAGVNGGNPLAIDVNGPGGEIGTTGNLVADQAAGTVLPIAIATPANALLTEGQAVTFDITQGAAADIGRAVLQIDWEPRLVT